MSDQDPLDEQMQKLLDDVNKAATTRATPAKRSQSSRKRGRRRDQPYRSALNESHTDRSKAAKATGKKSVVAGRYLRRSFTFRPDQLNSIEQLAARIGLSQNDLLRWFVDMGIEAVDQGESPPLTEEVRHRYDPDIKT